MIYRIDVPAFFTLELEASSKEEALKRAQTELAGMVELTLEDADALEVVNFDKGEEPVGSPLIYLTPVGTLHPPGDDAFVEEIGD
jgi:hypothetical protein